MAKYIQQVYIGDNPDGSPILKTIEIYGVVKYTEQDLTLEEQNQAKINLGISLDNITKADLDKKVDKVNGKQLSTNDFTTELKDQINTNKTNIKSHTDIKSGNPHNVSLSELADLENGKIPNKYISSSVIVDTFTVAKVSDLITLTTADKGDIGIVTEINKTYILSDSDYSIQENWKELLTPDCKVQSVNSQTGTVVLSGADIKTNASGSNTIKKDIEDLNANKVDKDGNKVLSDNNFTTDLMNKIGTNESNISKLTKSVQTNTLDLTNIKSKAEGSVTKDLQDQINNKVTKEIGKGLSTNDFTDDLKTKITTNESNISSINVTLENKVDKVKGKQLSTEDFTTALKTQIGTNQTDISNINSNLSNKVDKVNGKELSDRNFTQALENQISTNQTAITEINNRVIADMEVNTDPNKIPTDGAVRAYTKAEIAKFDFIKVVSELPTPDKALPNRIYMVPPETAVTTKIGVENQKDLFDEYIWTPNNDGTFHWEFVGTKRVEVDLTDYYNKSQCNDTFLAKKDIDETKLKALLNSITAINGTVKFNKEVEAPSFNDLP